MNQNTTFANREVCDLIFLEYKTQKPFLNLDFANTTTTEMSGEAVYAYGGKGHPKRVTFHGERGGTIAFETQMKTAKLYSLITGAAIEKSAKFIKREVLTCTTAGELTVTGTPIAGTISVYSADDDCGIELTSVTATGSKVSATGIEKDKEYIVYYITELTDKVLKVNIKSTTFPKAFTVYGETYEKTEDDEIVPYRMVAYKCSPQTNFSLSCANSGDPATITITCDLMADKDDNILDLIWEDEE